MNRQPVMYKQYDSKWGKKPYRVSGESSTIASAGCGPTCAAMIIATLKDKSVTPETTCNWSLAHGYKALNQGTYYSYFVPQFDAYNIASHRCNYDEAMRLLKQGWYVIALMGKGLWTTSGHFVLVWWADDKVRINDPASTSASRENGDPALFKAQAKYFWAIDSTTYNMNGNAVPGAIITERDTRVDTVKEVQEWLNKNYAAGLDNDGVYGKMTRKAITAALQRELGFTGKNIDGVFGRKTKAALPTISLGSSGVFVKLLQCLLVCNGYSSAYVDGSAGNGTISAIKGVQAKNRLAQDGICGAKTWSVLLK